METLTNLDMTIIGGVAAQLLITATFLVSLKLLDGSKISRNTVKVKK